jgi:uncharacterized protein (DUF58 family)
VVILLLGIFLIVANPLSESYVWLGMFLIAVAIITTLLPIFFPPKARVELRVVGTRTIPVKEIKKRVKGKRKIKRKSKKKTRKRKR